MRLKSFIYYDGKKKKIIKVKPVSPYSTGLMFKKNSANLLFSLKRERSLDITSLFCLPFRAIWLDKNRKILQSLDVKEQRWRIPGKGMYLVEIPLKNNKVPRGKLDDEPKHLNRK